MLICDGNNLAFRYLRKRNYDNYKADYYRTVESLAKSYGCSHILLTFDYGSSYYRNQLYSEYKGTREKPSAEEKDHYDKFFACLNDIADSNDFSTAKFRGVEADDLIARAVLKNKSNFDHIWIISSDRDIYQLLDDNVSIYNLYSRREITKTSLFEDLGVAPSEYMLSRVISGDTGDNVIGVDGIGEKRSAALAKRYKTLEELLKSLPVPGKAQYIKNLNKSKDMLILNEKLINLIDYNEEALLSGKEITLEEIDVAIG
jgi:DNA polymerase-1